MRIDSEKIKELKGKEQCNIDDLRDIMKLLRADGGCPWDREQTHKSIRNNFIEETYEVIEAIDTENVSLLKEELGDVLLQVVFHSEIEREAGSFDFDAVCDGVCKKLILRHPHVFGDVKADTSEQVLSNWDSIKSVEKHRESNAEKMRSVPPMLPALMRAEKIGKRAAKAGFDFENISQAAEKIYEETEEFLEASDKDAEEELGDLLFSVVNTARFRGVDSENALNKATEKFISRYEKAEALASADGRAFDGMTLPELDFYWEKAKKA